MDSWRSPRNKRVSKVFVPELLLRSILEEFTIFQNIYLSVFLMHYKIVREIKYFKFLEEKWNFFLGSS